MLNWPTALVICVALIVFAAFGLSLIAVQMYRHKELTSGWQHVGSTEAGVPLDVTPRPDNWPDADEVR